MASLPTWPPSPTTLTMAARRHTPARSPISFLGHHHPRRPSITAPSAPRDTCDKEVRCLAPCSSVGSAQQGAAAPVGLHCSRSPQPPVHERPSRRPHTCSLILCVDLCQRKEQPPPATEADTQRRPLPPPFFLFFISNLSSSLRSRLSLSTEFCRSLVAAPHAMEGPPSSDPGPPTGSIPSPASMTPPRAGSQRFTLPMMRAGRQVLGERIHPPQTIAWEALCPPL